MVSSGDGNTNRLALGVRLVECHGFFHRMSGRAEPPADPDVLVDPPKQLRVNRDRDPHTALLGLRRHEVTEFR